MNVVEGRQVSADTMAKVMLLIVVTGEPISTTTLAETLGLGRSTVHKALMALAKEKLLTHHPREIPAFRLTHLEARWP